MPLRVVQRRWGTWCGITWHDAAGKSGEIRSFATHVKPGFNHELINRGGPILVANFSLFLEINTPI